MDQEKEPEDPGKFYKVGCGALQPKYKRDNLKIIIDNSEETIENDGEAIETLTSWKGFRNFF